jgi:hypothetical protein
VVFPQWCTCTNIPVQVHRHTRAARAPKSANALSANTVSVAPILSSSPAPYLLRAGPRSESAAWPQRCLFSGRWRYIQTTSKVCLGFISPEAPVIRYCVALHVDAYASGASRTRQESGYNVKHGFNASSTSSVLMTNRISTGLQRGLGLTGL